MNFLLHHDFAYAELSDAMPRNVAAVGAMLPDFWRMADRRVRPSPLSAAHEGAAPEVGALLRGIEHHLTIDRWFHRSSTFVEGERRLRKRFFETKSPKLLLFAHAAWEMCLDGALVRQRGTTAIAAALAESLDAAEPHVGAAADIHHFRSSGRPPAERATFDARMIRILRAGRVGDLFDDYLTAEGIAKRLAGMRSAFGFARPGAEEIVSWERALEDAVTLAPEALLRLRGERGGALPPSEPNRS